MQKAYEFLSFHIYLRDAKDIWILGISHIFVWHKGHVHSRYFASVCLTQETCEFSAFHMGFLGAATQNWWMGQWKFLKSKMVWQKKNEITIFLGFLQIAHFRYKSRSFRGKSHSFLGFKTVNFLRKKNWNLLDWLHWWCSGTSLQRPKLWHDGWVLEPHRKLPWCQSFPLGIPVDRQLKFLFKAPKVFNG